MGYGQHQRGDRDRDQDHKYDHDEEDDDEREKGVEKDSSMKKLNFEEPAVPARDLTWRRVSSVVYRFRAGHAGE